MRLANKVAIVTGGGPGSGEGIAMRFAQEGARVVVNDIDPASAARVTQAIVDGGGQASAKPGDVTRDADVAALFFDRTEIPSADHCLYQSRKHVIGLFVFTSIEQPQYLTVGSRSREEIPA